MEAEEGVAGGEGREEELTPPEIKAAPKQDGRKTKKDLPTDDAGGGGLLLRCAIGLSSGLLLQRPRPLFLEDKETRSEADTEETESHVGQVKRYRQTQTLVLALALSIPILFAGGCGDEAAYRFICHPSLGNATLPPPPPPPPSQWRGL